MNGIEDERPEAVQHASTGATAWRAVVHAQQSATPNHSDFCALAGHFVDTLAALEALAGVLNRQVAGYSDGLPAGEVVYDDSRMVKAGTRLGMAVSNLEWLARAVNLAQVDAKMFWSEIGHIGVEDVTS